MRGVLVYCVVVVLAVSEGLAGGHKLEKRQVPANGVASYDQEIDKVLKNERLVQHYYKCLVEDRYRCRGDGLKLKKRFPQYLREGLDKDSSELKKDCKDSTCAAEKKAIKRLVKYFIVERPAMWDRVAAKYDPSGQYKKRYLQKYGAELKQNGITLPPRVTATRRS